MRHALSLFVVVSVLSGCGKKDEKKVEDKAPPAGTPTAEQPRDVPADEAAKPAEPPTPAPTPKGQATVDITLTGAIEKTLSGPIGSCQIPIIGGKRGGATYRVREGDLELAILATTDEEIKEPAIVLNVSGADRASFVLSRQKPTVKLDPGKSAEVEADLNRIGKKETVHVKGTFTCNPE